MLLGAGTVLTIDQVEKAVAAGAEFIVAPGFNPEVVDYCIDNIFLLYQELIHQHRLRWL